MFPPCSAGWKRHREQDGRVEASPARSGQVTMEHGTSSCGGGGGGRRMALCTVTPGPFRLAKCCGKNGRQVLLDSTAVGKVGRARMSSSLFPTTVMVAAGHTHPSCSLLETHVVRRLYVGRLSLDTRSPPSVAAASGGGRYVGTTTHAARKRERRDSLRFFLEAKRSIEGAAPPLASLFGLLLAGGEPYFRATLQRTCSCRHLMKRNIPLACRLPFVSCPPYTVGAKVQVVHGVKASLFLLTTPYCVGWDVVRPSLPRNTSRNFAFPPEGRRALEGGRRRGGGSRG